MKLILLGAPGAGKGTQAEIIAAKLNIPTISTGNILREAIKNGTETGLKAKSFMDAGKLVPDDVIIGIVAERVARPDCANGYILDGVPRTIPQAQALEDAGISFDHVVSIEIEDAVIEQRMTGRRVCGGCGASYHITAHPPKREGRPLSLLNETSIFLLSIDRKLSMLISSILTLKSNSFWNLSKVSSTAIDNESYFPIFKSKSIDEVTK